MRAFVPDPAEQDEQITAITCPDCPGTLAVHAENDHLRFRCRIDHVYSLQDLIEAKERRLEDLLWAPVTALEELAALLGEVIRIGKVIGTPEGYEDRIARARRSADMLRGVIEQNVKVNLGPGISPERP